MTLFYYQKQMCDKDLSHKSWDEYVKIILMFKYHKYVGKDIHLLQVKKKLNVT